LSLLNLVEDSDSPPTTQATAAVQAAERVFAGLTSRWESLRTRGLADLNAKLRSAGQPQITVR
jgi:hypothetical protein